MSIRWLRVTKFIDLPLARDCGFAADDGMITQDSTTGISRHYTAEDHDLRGGRSGGWGTPDEGDSGGTRVSQLLQCLSRILLNWTDCIWQHF
jgi:hypothetical protein